MTDTFTGEDQARPGVLHDRRRPGRRNVHPSLVSLLRGQAALVDEPALLAGSGLAIRDDLAPAVGVASGLGLAALAWIGIALLVLR